MVIPPAWDSVWICPWPHGHIQAVGFDKRGRLQYRYHDRWRVLRDQQKFDHMILFAQSLPRLRHEVARALEAPDAGEKLGRPVVLALAVRLLDLGCFRIGSDSYADENGTYGLASLERRHVRVRGPIMTFDFTGKGGQRCVQEVRDKLAADLTKHLRSRRPASGRLLEAEEGGNRSSLDSNDINEYIQAVTDGDFTTKEFRTWKATVLAAVGLARRSDTPSLRARKRAITATMKEVADYLGDTPAVARSSYVDPRVVDLYLDGSTLDSSVVERYPPGEEPSPAVDPAIEAAVLDLLGYEVNEGTAA